MYAANSGGTPRVNPVQVNRGGFHTKFDNCARGHASASAISDNDNLNVYLNESGLHNDLIANLVGCSPAQTWHVGNLADSAVKLVKCSLVKCFQWPYHSDACAKFGKSLFKENRSFVTPHVSLVRGSKLKYGEPGCRVLQGVVKDWLRANWPIVVYVKNRKALTHELLGPIFTSVGSGGHSFPVCSCSGTLGEHSIGTLFANLKGSVHTCTECAVGDKSKGKCKDWNGIAVGSALKRICNVQIACYIARFDRHRYRDPGHLIDREPLDIDVCSATKVDSATITPQRPPGIDPEYALHPGNPGP